MQKVCLIADNIRSALNVGSLFRTADGFSAELVLIGITPRPIGGPNDDRLPHISQKADKAIAKTAIGAEKTVKWRYYREIEIAVSTLRNEGYVIFAIEQSKKSISITEMNITKPTALIFGPEVDGLSHETLVLCDKIYEIPMYGAKESYNVAVSAGVALYQARLK